MKRLARLPVFDKLNSGDQPNLPHVADILE